ncbi:unnamed protein product [Linum trigynum]|uniref:Uncharacterized protein n=1 Tax=Linum trigynum TaxID=586398 RepID=A0AAV2CM67_9ROSI
MPLPYQPYATTVLAPYPSITSLHHPIAAQGLYTQPIHIPVAVATMAYVVLSELAWTDEAPVLKLRLLHTWLAGNPCRPDGFYEHSTLWTDELGVLGSRAEAALGTIGRSSCCWNGLLRGEVFPARSKEAVGILLQRPSTRFHGKHYVHPFLRG